MRQNQECGIDTVHLLISTILSGEAASLQYCKMQMMHNIKLINKS